MQGVIGARGVGLGVQCCCAPLWSGARLPVLVVIVNDLWSGVEWSVHGIAGRAEITALIHHNPACRGPTAHTGVPGVIHQT